SEQSGVVCRCTCPSEMTVDDPTIATHLYRIAQEAISNALRHGKPHEIVINLQQEDAHLNLSIRDDGIGLREKPSAGAGFGLQIMHYRANLIGGTLKVGSANGQG